MIYLYAFLFSGFVCAISQFVLEKTKFTPGHMNTILVIVGSIISGFGLYDKLLETFGSGASVLIMNFGNLLVKGAYEGYMSKGILGLFTGIYTYAGAGISTALMCAFITCLFFKIKH